MKLIAIPTILVLVFFCKLNAQQLLSPTFTFSKKKTSYITLDNDSKIEGTVSGIKYKKGLIQRIDIKDSLGVKHKLKPSSVKYMYLFPSGIDVLSKSLDFATDAQKWNNEKLEQDFLKQGHVYFETVNVKIKNKTIPSLMQLLNPNFSKKVKVYHDPFAKETASLGVGGVKAVGGNAKSYYIMINDDTFAYKIQKKKYDKEFKNMWSKCSTLSNMAEVKWKDLTEHIIKYTDCE